MNRPFMALVGAVLLGTTLATVPLGAPEADAASCVVIDRIYFDSPGSDYGSNQSLNAEWVQLRNRCSSGKSLKGWAIKDVAGHAYRFGTYTLRSGSTVKVHTGRGSNTAANRYWGSDWYIWNNDGDTARLRNAAGSLVDTCAYRSNSGGSTSC